MRRPHRLVMALALLASGTGVALVSRRHVEWKAPDAPAQSPKPRQSVGPLPVALPEEPVEGAHLSGIIEAAETARDAPTDPFRRKADIATSRVEQAGAKSSWRPSTRTASFLAASSVDSTRREIGVRPRPLVSTAQTVYLMHRIVDGDTLSSLAQRYLGSSERFKEIFEANRDRLQATDVLPIGVVLRIPVERASGDEPG